MESHAGWGVSLSLVHLPPGVRLLTYYRSMQTKDLELSAHKYSGEPTREDVCVQDLWMRPYDM